jgi:purine-binding chemotaxis protein CheW
MSAETTGTLSLVRCGVGGETYGLDMSCVRGILRSDRLRRAAGPDGLVGHLAEREGALPVYSLAARLGRPTPSVAGQPVVVVSTGAKPWGLLVDRVSQVARVEASAAKPLPGVAVDPLTNCLEGIVQREGETIFLLSLMRLNPGVSGGESAPASLLAAACRVGAPSVAPLATARRPSQKQLVLFATSDPPPRQRPLTFGLTIAQVLEIRSAEALVPVPNASEHCLGLANWHDWPVGVLDLAGRLGMSGAPPSEQSRLLIARAPGGSDLVGFLVRPSIRVLRLPVPHEPCTRQLNLDQSLLKGCIELKNETLVLPDLRRLCGGNPHLEV